MPAFDPSVDPFAPSEQAQETPSSQLDETLAQLLTSYNLLANAVGNVQVDGLVGDTVSVSLRCACTTLRRQQDKSSQPAS